MALNSELIVEFAIQPRPQVSLPVDKIKCINAFLRRSSSWVPWERQPWQLWAWALCRRPSAPLSSPSSLPWPASFPWQRERLAPCVMIRKMNLNRQLQTVRGGDLVNFAICHLLKEIKMAEKAISFPIAGSHEVTLEITTFYIEPFPISHSLKSIGSSVYFSTSAPV